MRLLRLKDEDKLEILEFFPPRIPAYAILSHTWARDNQELTFKDVVDGKYDHKIGHRKVLFCGKQAIRDGFEHFWVDSCCIDKTSSAELSEAINSMFRWYQDAKKCYVFLADVSANQSPGDPATIQDQWMPSFRKSRWFSRGWTLQELLAPQVVEFFSETGLLLGSKASLEQPIHEITHIDLGALRGQTLDSFQVDERMAWAQNRQTTRAEDMAYCLLGIFGIQMPLIYGEGATHAMDRLNRKVRKRRSSPDARASRKSHLVMPFGRNRDLVGREKIFDHIFNLVLPDACKDDCQRVVIEGLGGIGKTQIAIETTYRIRDMYPDCSVFWIPAMNSTTVANAFRQIGRALAHSAENDAELKRLAKDTLSEAVFGRWLLVIDNADDTTVMSGLLEDLPFSTTGAILCTTRNHEVTTMLDARSEDIFTLTAMTESEALTLLRHHLKPAQLDDERSTRELLDVLSRLPLAIRQASAYMSKTEMSTSRYLRLCLSSDENFVKLLSNEFGDKGRYPSTKNPIATTWLVSFEYILETKPLAGAFLKFMSFLVPVDIPASLVPGLDDDNLDAEEAAATLKGYGFITQRDDPPTFDMHRLVQLPTQNWLRAQEELEGWAVEAAQRLQHVCPHPTNENKSDWIKYLPHMQKVLALSDGEELISGADYALARKAADAYTVLGQYHRAEPTYRAALDYLQSRGGLQNGDTIIVMNHLAGVLGKIGHSDEGEGLMRQALEVITRVMSPNHPLTMTATNNLALAVMENGRHEEAEEMQREVLRLRQEILGSKHPDTLVSLGNLATNLQRQHKLPEAEQLQRQVLLLEQAVLGPEAATTIRTMNNLAGTLRDQCKYAEAETIYRQVVDLMKRVLGPEHSDTLHSMHSMAHVLYSNGEYRAAETLLLETIELRSRVLGAYHRDTLASTNELGLVLSLLHKHDEALKVFREINDLTPKASGPDHPNTFTGIANLAFALEKSGERVEAEELYRSLVSRNEDTFGAEDPRTAKARRELDAFLDRTKGDVA